LAVDSSTTEALRVPALDSAGRLAFSTIFSYNVPTIGMGYMFLFVSLYLMKFSTDVLLVAPASMGLIFGVSRIWDAVTDPLAGYFSDRTKTRMGRRRPWLLAAIVPVGVSYIMMWSPPASLEGTSLTLWMAASIFLFYSSMTIVIVPHTSLGAELSDNYHERTRIFGVRHVTWGIGSMAAVGGMAMLIGADDPRGRAMSMAIIVTIATGLMLIWAVVGLRERPEYQGRGEENPFKAFKDVFANPHARLLLGVFIIESLGGATIGILTPYVAEYIVGRPEQTPLFIMAYMIPSIASVPVWVRLSRHTGKKSMWIFSMLLTAAGFGSMFFLQEGDSLLITVLAVICGLGAGSGAVVGPSIQSDIIDYDEFVTGQRKEGAYFAAWNFCFKASTGITLMLTGVALSSVGFVPNQVQTPDAQFALRGLYALFPLACYSIGALIFSRFSLNEEEHNRIRSELDRRNAALRSGSRTASRD
jgi:GPH family glycoside/pentoside/hexuronide:cation symporter